MDASVAMKKALKKYLEEKFPQLEIRLSGQFEELTEEKDRIYFEVYPFPEIDDAGTMEIIVHYSTLKPANIDTKFASVLDSLRNMNFDTPEYEIYTIPLKVKEISDVDLFSTTRGEQRFWSKKFKLETKYIL